MLGPPGAGKGTQAERFAMGHRIPRISTGDILRDAVHAGNQIGRAAKVVMDRGELVSDDVMIGIVTERLSRPDAVNGFVLERFKIYQRATKPLVDFYRQRPTFRCIYGAQPLDGVTTELASAVAALTNGGGVAR